MPEVMNELREDHANIALILRLLNRELEAVRAAASADFELMHDIMVYMTHYPDSTHHPKEDLMFERLRAHTGAANEEIEALEREHHSLAEKGSHFRDTLRRVVDGSMVERAELAETGQDYCDFLDFHMQREDRDIFPLAEKTLNDADWSAVADAFAAQLDPVFGPVVAREYRSLLESIRRDAE